MTREKGFWLATLAGGDSHSRPRRPAGPLRSHSFVSSFLSAALRVARRPLTPTPTVQFGFVHESLLESAGNFSIPVSLSAVSASNVTVPFVLGGTAISGTDYTNVVAGGTSSSRPGSF